MNRITGFSGISGYLNAFSSVGFPHPGDLDFVCPQFCTKIVMKTKILVQLHAVLNQNINLLKGL